MARPRKMETAGLLQLVDDFFSEVAAGDPRQLKCSNLERYAQTRGLEVKAYDFRRDTAVREHMEKLKRIDSSPDTEPLAAAFRDLDFTEILRRSPDLESLKCTLTELNAYWKSIYDASVALLQKNRELQTQYMDCEDSRKKLEKDFDGVTSQFDGLIQENRRLCTENTYLRKQLRTYLYPALAEELLREEGMPVDTSRSIKPIAFTQMLEGKAPAPFPGTQTERKLPDRERRLLEQMEVMVNSDGT